MKKAKIIGNVLLYIAIFIVSLISFSINWCLETWVNLTMEELVYTVTALEGTGGGMISQYVMKSVVPSILVVLILIVVCVVFHKKHWNTNWVKFGAISLSLILLVVHICTFYEELDVSTYLENQSAEAVFIEQHYINPMDVRIEFPEEERNLIFIFCESMETTYTDKENGGGFVDNYIPELTELAQVNEDFSGVSTELNGGYTLPGTTWTMGALFAQTCGIPLQTSIDGNSMNTQETFFPGIVNLGDILEARGYEQVFMIGSEATFGGRDMFFREHGDYNILDYEYAIDASMIPGYYKVSWGYEDGKLFEFAKDEISRLAENEEPFNFTLLTVDTHFEDGYVCEDCEDVYESNQYANVIACSSNKVAEFVEWIQQQAFYENTTIVVVGDHLTMDSDFCNEVEEDYERKTYTCFINAGCINEQPEKTRTYTTMDIFPTTLAALGAKIDGERLGLGTNLFSSTNTLAENYGLAYMESEVAKQSVFLKEMGQLNENTDAYLMSINKYPTAVVSLDSNEANEKIQIKVSSIANIEKLSRVELDIWEIGEEKNKKTILMKAQENKYTAELVMSNYKKGALLGSAIYVVDEDGRRYQVGELPKDWELYTNNLWSYLDVLENKDYTVFLAVQDDAATSLNLLARQKLKKLGLKTDLYGQMRSSYYAVIDNGQVISEEVSKDRIYEEGTLRKNTVEYSIMSSGYYAEPDCSIRINGVENAINWRGMNFVVYDSQKDVVVDSVCFDTCAGITVTRAMSSFESMTIKEEVGYKADVNLQVEDFVEYLSRIKDNSSYAILIAVHDEAGKGLTEEMKSGLKELGLETDFSNFYRNSYYAIIQGDNVEECSSLGAISVEGLLDDGTVYRISSANYLVGAGASIKLQEKEFAMGVRGMNFVVYDKDKKCVVDTVCYDTHTNEDVVRK